jgi:predicted NACHT family NTPase
LADGGYLCDPDGEWDKAYNPELVSLKAIADIPCLILLGEPGIGKSHAIKEAVETKTYEQDPLVLDLHSYGSEDRLIKNLFESSQFRAWVEGNHLLYVFLDSLDECLLRIDNVTALLAEEFRRYQDKANRLFLRIICRSAVWQSTFEEQLQQIFGKDKVKIYELAPLRQIDVRHAAEREGIEDPDHFMQEIWDKKVVPLAIKPITLGFLMEEYLENSHFSQQQTLFDLYFRGCRRLCDEEDRSDPRRPGCKGNLELDQRLIIAARIAAVTVFTRRGAIWFGGERGKIPEDDVLSRELVQGYERANARQFEASEAAITEVLGTGLFSLRGANRMGWAHQTYAEFLAAWYLTQRNLDLSQILSLILHPDDRVVPQLQETTAWLASMNSDVFQKIMEIDPDVLLQSDLATIDEAIKASLVESLLQLHDQNKLVYQYRFKGYESLKHSALAAQLQPYILDSTKSIHSRYIAIDIAEKCNVQAVQSSLADVALAPKQPYWVRIRAVQTLIHVGDEDTKARLKPLVTSKASNDPEDYLKGFALRAVYPNHITTEEVFENITQPKANFSGGSYQEFIANKLGQILQPSDLLVALRWVEKQLPRRDLHYPFGELSDAIMLKAWERFEEPEIRETFTKIAISRLKEYDGVLDYNKNQTFKQELRENDNKRRRFIEAVVSMLPDSERDPLWLIGDSMYCTLTVQEQDFLWMLECLEASESKQTQKIYAKLIKRKLDGKDLEHADVLLRNQVNALLGSYQNNSTLKAEFWSVVEPIKLNSARAKQERAGYLETREMLNSYRKQPLLDPPPKERVLAALKQFESGQVDAWWYLCCDLKLTPEGRSYGMQYEPDLTALPGWEEAEEETRVRILTAAKIYIAQGEPETNAWVGTAYIRHSALGGYLALRLISAEELSFISTISADIWRKWTAIILDYPNGKDDKDQQLRQQLIKRTYQNAPDEFIKTLIILIEKENTQHGSVYIHHEIECCWDECLAEVLLNKVQDKKLKARSVGDLLRELLVHRVDQAKVFAESLISLPPPTDGEARVKAIVAAKMLMLYSEDAGWSVVWSAIQQDPKFGREVLEAVSYVVKYEGNIEQRLKEDCVADLYIFLAQQYPTLDEQQKNSDDTEPTGVEAYVVGPEDSIRTWKDYIPQRLQELGTQEACDALRKIIYELPELKDKLQWRLLEAEALVRRKTWQPPTPEQIFQIVNKELPAVKTILILASSPVDEARLRLDKEVREIDEGLRRSQKRDQFRIEQRWAVRTDDLRRALLDTEPQIVHFCGHGTGDAGILVEDNNGHAKLVSTEALSSLFELFADHVECVLLNACYSEVQADAIVKNITYVIGMSDSIGDGASIKFSTGFYDALGAGKPIETAYKFGCNAIQLENIPGHLTPRLKKKQ